MEDLRPIIYTAIFGGYEELKEPTVITPGWRYICFTDRVQPFSKVWEVNVDTHFGGNARLWCRRAKILPYFAHHPGGPMTIWVDGSFVINVNLDDFVACHPGDFAVMQHPLRDCAYEEAEFCVKLGRGVPKDILAQITNYSNQGMPRHGGLIQSGILLRRFTPEVRSFCEHWLEQVFLWSSRDQISFSYVNWKEPGVTKAYPFNYATSTEFIYKKHEYKN